MVMGDLCKGVILIVFPGCGSVNRSRPTSGLLSKDGMPLVEDRILFSGRQHPLPGLQRKLSSVHGHALEMIEAGFRIDAWATGLSLLTDCLDSLQMASAATESKRAEELGKLRDSAQRLRARARRMGPDLAGES